MESSHLRLVHTSVTPAESASYLIKRALPANDGPRRFRDALVQAANLARASGRNGKLLVHLEAPLDSDSNGIVLLDAICASGHSPSFASLNLRVRCAPRFIRSLPSLSSRVLNQAGGTRYASLTASRKLAGRIHEAFDVVVCFPHGFPYLAHNLVNLPKLMRIEQVAVTEHVLTELGVKHRREHATFDTARLQLRRPLQAASVQRAFAAAVSAGLSTAVYVADLPLSRSARIEVDGGRDGFLDLCLNVGTGQPGSCSPDDCDAIQDLIESELDCSIGTTILRPRLRDFVSSERQPSSSDGLLA